MSAGRNDTSHSTAERERVAAVQRHEAAGAAGVPALVSALDDPSWGVRRTVVAALGRLEFFAPDPVRFPALRLAYHAVTAGGTAGAVAVMNAGVSCGIRSLQSSAPRSMKACMYARIGSTACARS